MAYIFTAITGGQTVGQAFTRVNQNLAAIEDNIPTGGTVSGNFLPLSGGSLTGNVIMATGTNLKVENGFNWIIYSGNSIQFYDDNFATNINLKPSYPFGQEVDITLSDFQSGDIVVVPTFTSNRFIGTRNLLEDGYNFIQLSGGTNVTINTNSDGSVYTINASSGPSGGGITGLTSAGTGSILLLSSITNNRLVHKSISAGTGMQITESNGTLVFVSTATGSTGTGSTSFTGITTASTVGGGVSLISAITNNNLQLNSISGTAGMVVNAASNGLITFRGPNTANRVFMTDASGNMVNSDFLFTDNTNDTLGIGIAAATTARLLLPAQTASITPLRFTKSTTNYTGNIDGSLWYLTSGDSLKFRKNTVTTDFIFKDNNVSLTGISNNRVVQSDINGTLTASDTIVSFGIFNMLTSVTITDSTTETSILNTGGTVFYGTNVINSSSHGTQPQLVAGKKFRFTANGTIATHSSAGNLTARLKLGNTVIASISGFNLHNNISAPNNFYIESSFTIRTQGASGTVIGGGFLQTDHDHLISNAQTIVGLNNLGSVTLDTTSDRVFDFTFQFGTASVNNIITINEATLEYLN
jgi:hypothetical protein